MSKIQSVHDVEHIKPEDLTLEEWQQIAARLSRMLKARTEECKRLNMELTLLKLERDCTEPGTLH